MQGEGVASNLAHVGLILLVAFALFFLELGNLPFYSHGEPREALEVWDMIHRGEWILPMRNGLEVPSKPPLFHWLGALTALATGSVDELSTRFPSALLATLTVLAVYFRARRWGAVAGLFAALILMTNLEFIRAARSARVDMALTACLTASFLALERALTDPRPRTGALIVLYVFTGLAALAKGPVGIVLPALVALVWIALTRDFRRVWQVRPISGGLTVLLIAGSWYVMAILSGGDSFVNKQLLRENLGRFVGVDDGGANQAHPIYYYLQGIGTGFAPWSLFLIPLSISLYRRRGEIAEQSVRFLVLCTAVVLAFYSAAAGKRTVYVLSLYPLLAILLGAWWSELAARSFNLPRAAMHGLKIASAVLAAALLVVVAAFVSEAAGIPLLDRVGPFLHHRDRENLPMVRELIRAHLPTLSVWLVSLAGCATALIVGAHRGRWNWIFGAMAGFVVSVTLAMNHVFEPRLAAERSFKRFALRTADLVSDAELHFYRTWDYGVVFYLGRRVPVISAEQFRSWSPDHPSYVLLFEKDWDNLNGQGNVPSGGEGNERQSTETETAAPRLQLVERSVETGHQGKMRLVLARVSPAGESAPR